MTPWKIHTTGPMITPGQIHGKLDISVAGAAHVVQLGDRYRMVYWGSSDKKQYHILAAESSVDRPNDWTPLGPLLGPQPDTQHNCRGPGFPFLLPVDEKRWLLYFCGWGHRADGKLPNTTGVAISDDAGKTFRYHDTHPVIPLDRPWDREGTGSVVVEHDATRQGAPFRMWYTAIGPYVPKPEGVRTGHGDIVPQIGIAYAESDDGLTWRKPVDRLVVSPRGFEVQPYEYICSKPALLRNPDGGYTLWVNTFGSAYRVHRLTSADGLAWQWGERVGPEGELGVGEKGAYDDHQRSYPTMIRHGSEIRCWFTGNRFGIAGMGYATQPAQG